MNESFGLLKEACCDEIKNLSLNTLQKSRQELSSKYREKRDSVEKNKARFIQTQADRLTYLITRMPATAAVIRRVLKELVLHQPTAHIESLLDIGAGSGSSLWAFSVYFPNIRTTLIEQDSELIALGKKLAGKSPEPCFSNTLWCRENILNMKTTENHDVGLFSYVLNELPQEHHLPLIESVWKAVDKFLILIEPGTPQGFQNILSARTHLISLGASILAPCPHINTCPLAKEKDRWCHFSERLERSREHRLLKEGNLGYEDEKYSYLILSKNRCPQYSGRVLSHPQKRSGHIHLELCTAEGYIKKTLSKSEGEIYKQAKKLDWGDSWE